MSLLQERLNTGVYGARKLDSVCEELGIQIPDHLVDQLEIPAVHPGPGLNGKPILARQGDIYARFEKADLFQVDDTGKITCDPDAVNHEGVRVVAPFGRPQTVIKNVNLVEGDHSTGGNSHILDCPEGGVWYPAPAGGAQGFYCTDDIGLLALAPGAEAYLTHTDEHGSIAFKNTTDSWQALRLWGQVNWMGEELQRVAD